MSSDVMQEGGLGGHMDHLYDNPNLSFGEMKEIFQLAASGKLEGTQKLDGQNIFITYSLKRGRAFAARNKTNLKSGGMSGEQLAAKFEGRGALQKAFVDAFQAFEEAVSSFSEQEIIDLFDNDSGNLDLLDRHFGTLMLSQENLNHPEFGLKFHNYSQRCQVRRQAPKGRVLVALVALRFRVDRQRGRVPSQVQIYKLECVLSMRFVRSKAIPLQTCFAFWVCVLSCVPEPAFCVPRFKDTKTQTPDQPPKRLIC